jgi:hypothetical protein
MNALERMRSKHDRLDNKVVEGSLLSLIAGREYLKPAVLRLVEALCEQLSAALPLAFQRNEPKDEIDLNDKISAILSGGGEKSRESIQPFNSAWLRLFRTMRPLGKTL